MAHITENSVHGATLADRFAALRTSLATARARRKAYRTTFNELSMLTDRELNDLGVHRSMIRGIAKQAADNV